MNRNLSGQMKARHSSAFVAVAVLGGLFLGLGSASAQRWIRRTTAPATNWISVASSADGTKLVAAVEAGGIYTSSDSGTNWTLTSAPATNWICVASSADGTKLVAAGEIISGVYISSDSGTNWTENSGITNLLNFAELYWSSVASSADGTKLVGVGDGIFTSSDYGANWTEQPGAPETNDWTSVASSADGTKLVAASVNYGYGNEGIFTSSDSGTNWTHTSASDSWVASSADGTKLVAACLGGGGIYTSSDSGTNWTHTTAPDEVGWTSLASSADGTKLVALAGNSDYGNGIYTSSDSGTNWTLTSAPADLGWTSVASSADGTKLVAVAGVFFAGAGKGGLYTFDASSATHGSLQVTIEPAGAVSAGAQWRVDGGTYRKSATTATNLSVGTHTVSFKTISGWNTPSNQMVAITNGETTTAAAIYEEMGNPKLTITSPKSGQSVSNALLLVTGTVKDNVAEESVSYQLNGGSWTLATPSNSWSNWTASVTLNPGANTIRAYAQDTNGGFSPTNKVTFTFIPSAILSVSTNGNGTFTPNDNGELLALGTNYTLTAKPGHHWIFSNWVASRSENFVSNNPVLNFKMQSNLVLQANFVTNVFLEWAMKGTYHGLFAPANAPRQQTNSGAITFTVKTNGVLSGKLAIGTNTPSLTGQFNPAGATTITTPRKGESNLITTLQLDFANQTVSGSVTDGSFDAQVIADLEQKTTNYEGRYTLIIPGTNDPTVGPFGTSCGTVTVQSGTISFVGYLADGTNAVSQTSAVSKDGYWPFYLPLYGTNGSLWSWNCFTNTNGAMIIFSTNASWINATNSNKAAVYRAGFTNPQASIIGSVYTSTNKPLLALTNGQVILQGGNLPVPITNQIALASNNAITLTAATENTNQLALTITKTNGVIRGTFVNPSNPRQTNRISGVLLQSKTNAAGFFLGANQSGAFLLAP